MIGRLAIGRHVREPDGDQSGDGRLIVRICARDVHAFEELYHRYHARLTRFLLHIVHQPHIVEEVLNDTMMAVWEKPASYRGASRLSTWIFAIAYHKAMKALRRRDDPVEDIQAENRASEEETPDEHLNRTRVGQSLQQAMEQLSVDHRTVVDLTYFHQMGYREIAEIMGCPVDTIKTRMFHARRHLRRLLAGEPADWL
ncbi:RNA polymerase sigma factor [Sphingobium sp. EM0848]|uniref:RNA polymerase sigma factor n=1 Tax=Sphingobium sp. EM0848 TaxID=2743473 RepID=UPI002101A132|nr:sigma-70 family RNA polymerase sigma factor [Sphingobium sp. EM0848]